jgi:hypothetical protein
MQKILFVFVFFSNVAVDSCCVDFRDISLAQAWGWEVIFSGLLVFCYYAMLLEPYRRSHGRMGPLGIGTLLQNTNKVSISQK